MVVNVAFTLQLLITIQGPQLYISQVLLSQQKMSTKYYNILYLFPCLLTFIYIILKYANKNF